jgi:hypothetical protein
MVGTARRVRLAATRRVPACVRPEPDVLPVNWRAREPESNTASLSEGRSRDRGEEKRGGTTVHQRILSSGTWCAPPACRSRGAEDRQVITRNASIRAIKIVRHARNAS